MLRPDLNGLRVQIPRNNTVYLIDQGKRRAITGIAYNQLFQDMSGIIQDLDVFEIDEGVNIPNTAILFKTKDNATVWLLDGVAPHQVKRGITYPAMARYNFNWNKIQVWDTPLSAISYPDGPLVDLPNVPGSY